MANALQQMGFAVTLLRDAELRRMREAIETFRKQLRPGVVGLFYFAGHGLQVKGENYLVPIGAQIAREQDVEFETVDVRRILGAMEDADNGVNVIILDACRNNPFARSLRSSQRGLAVTQAITGSLIAYATAPGSVAADGSGRNGVYTSHLLQNMRIPGLPIEQVFKNVRIGVMKETGNKQTPWESSSLTGHVMLIPAAENPAPVQISQPQGPQVAVGSYPQQPQTPSATIVGNDGAEMVLVPAGEFSMGSDADEIDRLPNAKREDFEDEIPRHRVYLEAFYIDRYEVTNAHFQQFVQATGHRTQAEREGWGYADTGEKWEKAKGANWRAPHGPGSNITGLEQHPVVQVSHEDAKAYCAWAGKRLPTEAEWEKAARGTDGRVYPWGNQSDWTRLNFCDYNCKRNWKDQAINDGYRHTAPVGRYEGGKSPYGAYDMAGNVWEWVTDWYAKDYYKNSPTRNPQGPASGEQAVLRGGGWNGRALGVRVPHRRGDAPAGRNDLIGFRCAKAS
jgi:formylglycine-generating enzyme required for sulfatase activity